MKVALFVSLVLLFSPAAMSAQRTRTMRPDDLFQLRRVGATAWSPDGQYVTIEISRSGRWLDGVPENDLLLLDVKTRSWRLLHHKSRVSRNCVSAQDMKQDKPTDPKFKVGQKWSYNERPGEKESYLIIVKIDDDAKLGRIIHIALRGVKVKNPRSPEGISDTVDHLAVA